MRNPPEPDSTFFPLLKMHTNLLSYMLKKNKGIDAIINPNYHPSKIEDGHYLYILKNNPNLKNDFSAYILALCRKKINIKNAFDKSQIMMIAQIAKKIKLEDVKNFFDLEFERLQSEVKPDDIKEKNIEIWKNRHEDRVSKLIASFKTNPSDPIDLNLGTFFMLIREYCIVTDFLMGSKSSDEDKKRLHEISTLIHENRKSVVFFKDSNVLDRPKLKEDIIIYMHALCFNGHINNLETLMKDYLSEKDLLSVVNAIKQESNFKGVVSISGLNTVIDKRIKAQKKDGSGLREDTSRWNEVKKIFDNALKKREDKPRASLKAMLWRALAVGAIFQK
jgi:hypothetical protein